MATTEDLSVRGKSGGIEHLNDNRVISQCARLLNANGMWRSPVAQRSGGPEVASSNLVIPTKEKSNYLITR